MTTTEARAMRAAIYTRLSHVDEDDAATGRQGEDCEAYCERRQWPVAARLVDSGASGWTGKERADFERLLTLIETDQIDAVVAWRFDRLTRNLPDYARLHQAAKENDVVLIGCRDGVDTSTSTGELVATIMFGTAKAESDAISARVSRQREQAARQGRPPMGPRPFGYDQGLTAIRESEATLIRKAVHDVLDGKSIADVVREWNDDGVQTTRGNRWKATSVKQLLISPRNAALREYKGEIVADGDWEPILDRETYERLQAYFRVRKRPMGRPREHLLTGTLFCGKCGAKLYAHGGGKSRRRGYRCKRIVGQQDDACQGIRIVADDADAFVRDMLIEAVAGGGGLAKARAAHERSEPDTKRLAADLEVDEGRKEQLAEMFADGKIDQRQFLAGTNKLDDRIADARATLERLTETEMARHIPAEVDELTRWWERVTPDTRRQLVDMVIERIEVQPCPPEHFGRRDTMKLMPDRIPPEAVTWKI